MKKGCNMFKTAIITISDKGSRGERIDGTGPAIQALLPSDLFEVTEYSMIPDDQALIEETLITLSDSNNFDLILTNGGTGFSKRDVTPEATINVVEKLTPGINEAMRLASLKITPKAMLSRSASGIRGNTLIINLPGSPKAASENLAAILPALPHGIEILIGSATECGSN